MHTVLKQYCALVQEANTKINLVSRKDVHQLYEHHVMPSLLFLDLERVLPGDHILDIGSGAGFPGLVLAIMEPNLQVTVTDSIKKKADFLRAFTAKTTNCILPFTLQQLEVANH